LSNKYCSTFCEKGKDISMFYTKLKYSFAVIAKNLAVCVYEVVGGSYEPQYKDHHEHSCAEYASCHCPFICAWPSRPDGKCEHRSNSLMDVGLKK